MGVKVWKKPLVQIAAESFQSFLNSLLNDPDKNIFFFFFFEILSSWFLMICIQNLKFAIVPYKET